LIPTASWDLRNFIARCLFEINHYDAEELGIADWEKSGVIIQKR
jgi:hypothetical protein